MISFLIILIDILDNLKNSIYFLGVTGILGFLCYLGYLTLVIADEDNSENRAESKAEIKRCILRIPKFLLILIGIYTLIPSDKVMYTAMGVAYLTTEKNMDLLDSSRELLLLKVQEQIKEIKEKGNE